MPSPRPLAFSLTLGYGPFQCLYPQCLSQHMNIPPEHWPPCLPLVFTPSPWPSSPSVTAAPVPVLFPLPTVHFPIAVLGFPTLAHPVSCFLSGSPAQSATRFSRSPLPPCLSLSWLPSTLLLASFPGPVGSLSPGLCRISPGPFLHPTLFQL